MKKMNKKISITILSGFLVVIGFQNCSGNNYEEGNLTLASACIDRSIPVPNYIEITDQGTQSSLNGSLQLNLANNQLMLTQNSLSCAGTINTNEVSKIKTLLSRISYCDKVSSSVMVIRTQNANGQIGGSENASPDTTQLNGSWQEFRSEINRLIQLASATTTCT